MKAPTSKEERKVRDADFERRLQPRLVWDVAKFGTYRRRPARPQYSGKMDPALVKAKARRWRRARAVKRG